MNNKLKTVATVLFNFLKSIFIRYKTFIIIYILFQIYKNYLSFNKYHVYKNSILVIHINMNHLSQTKEYVETLFSIRHAKNNKQIQKLHIDLSQIVSLDNKLSYSFSVLEELRDTLMDFKKKGKKISAWSSNYDIKSYYLASVAHEIMISPGGSILLNGLYVESKFYTNMLDRISLPMKTFRADNNNHKGYIEQFTRENFSKENRIQIEIYLNQVIKRIIPIIEESINDRNKNKNTKISSEDIIFIDINEAKKKDIIQTIINFDELYTKPKQPSIIDTFANPDDRLMPKLIEGNSIEIIDYVKNIPTLKNTAILFINGQLGNSMFSKGVDENKIKREVDFILNNKNKIENVIIAIDSPGGAVSSGINIFHHLNKLRANKFKITVIQGTMAASGGYWLSVISKNIISRNLTVTGSIGVLSMIPNTRKFWENIGINYDNINEDKNFLKNLLSENNEDNNINIKFKDSLNRVYETFKDHILQNRGHVSKNIDFQKVGGGRIFSGSDAKDNFLVDNISDLYSIVNNINKNKNIVKMPIILNSIDPNENNVITNARSLIMNFKKINVVLHNLQEYIKNSNLH